ncbi:hypothetical protein MMC13_001165 [Lambiella insularis]|nr:hypothetical protein [Lambiella insularis]
MEFASPESLPSEDWISQPRSSVPASEDNKTSVLQRSNNTSQSRIPRRSSRSVSNSSLPSRNGSGSPVSLPERRHGHVLSERTASNINIVQKPRLGSANKSNEQQSTSLHLRSGKRQASTNSVDSALLGTIQYRDKFASSQPESRPGATPEWKRRFLATGGTSGKQPDLFSPIGLESMFKAPTSRQEPLERVTKTKENHYKPTIQKIYPSSPPPYPSALPGPSRAVLRGSVPSPRPSSKLKRLDSDDCTHPWLHPVRSRVGSVESVSHNEEISAVQVFNGIINYETGLQQASRCLQPTKETTSPPVKSRPRSNSTVSATRSADGSAPNSKLRNNSSIDRNSHSIPEDLSIDTEAYISRGGFVKVLRGSNSASESFQRMSLSPSSFHPSEISIQDSDHLSRQILQDGAESRSFSAIPNVDHRSILSIGPVTPTEYPVKGHETPDPPKSSGSPLKLFDKYDTFTNERLVRRMSQFAESLVDSISDDEHPRSPSHQKSQCFVDPSPNLLSGIADRRISSFGEGALDDFDFTHRQLAVLDQLLLEDSKDFQETFPPLPQLHPKGYRFGGRRVSSARARRANYLKSLSKSQRKGSTEFEDDFRDCKALEHQLLTLSNKEGKRFPASPVRDPNPKRRRTITQSLMTSSKKAEDDVDQLSGTKAMAGQKRKDACYEISDQTADPEVLASRPMLLPRSLTLNHNETTSSNLPAEFQKDRIDETKYIQTAITESTPNDNDASAVVVPVQALAGELASFALDVAQDITYGDRKASVTTADFTSAANLIMQNIRAQGRPQSSRASGEGTGMGQLAGIAESPNEGSTVEEFSRPPSRECGGTLRRLRDQKQLDPRVISHLRKFEEIDETGIALSSSLRPLQTTQEDPLSPLSHMESDPPNLRIISNWGTLFPKEGKLSSVASLEQHQRRSTHSQPSSGMSTTRSVPTGSSSGSGNKATIAPDKVSHLLSDHVAGMAFDRTRQVWVRKRSAENTKDDDADRTASDLTEDDPLKEIPDLSVDELEELNRVKLAALNSRPASNNTTINIDIAKAHFESSGVPMRNEIFLQRLKSDTSPTPEAAADPQSGNCKVTSNACKAEDSRTSLLVSTKLGEVHPKDTNIHHPVQDGEDAKESEEVEHEISILEGRSTPARLHQRHHQPRVVTVAFSSPLSNHRLGSHGFRGGIWVNKSDDDVDDSPVSQYPEKRRTASRRPSRVYSAVGSFRGRSKVSIGSKHFPTRPVSRIDEHDEVSPVRSTECVRNDTMDLILSTPQAFARVQEQSVAPTGNGMHSNVTFHLSPLSDFTIHQRDDYPDSDVHAAQKAKKLLKLPELNGQYSLAIQDLVEKITDVEPYEPYWEYIRKLNMKNKNLATLYMLDDFCPRIEELDVSGNELEQLDGAPLSIRTLNIRGNCLSNLTAWGHLCNLQYLDVSRNQLKTLNGLSCLVHLREIVADDNRIESLDGLANLNGLIKLRLSRNALECLDFRDYDMRRLEELDVESNCLKIINNLYELPAIAHLNLRKNNLTCFPSGMAPPVSSLRFLDISINNIEEIDIACFPKLQTLQLDRNRIIRVQGLKHCANLSTVSWRKQFIHDAANEMSVQLEGCQDLKTLRLSGNRFQTFNLGTSFLNLQRLELASTGLDCLPKTFGLELPNLRFLNLNHNAVKDLRPLLGITKLAELHVAGNRIARLRRTTTVLRKLGKAIESLDCRSNPLTIGFYSMCSVPHIADQQIVLNRHGDLNDGGDHDAEHEAATAFVFSCADESSDQQHRETIDEDTALRRRVYEMLVLGGCLNLTRLDGLRVQRGMVEKRDVIWNRLLDLGVLREKRVGSRVNIS